MLRIERRFRAPCCGKVVLTTVAIPEDPDVSGITDLKKCPECGDVFKVKTTMQLTPMKINLPKPHLELVHDATRRKHAPSRSA